MLWLQRQWFSLTPWQVVLLPLSILFGLVVALRRGLYRVGLLRAIRLPVPVIVVGNISVGGTGKTPLVLWLTDFLRQHGYHPGVVSRGYGGGTGGMVGVDVGSEPAVVGDEPLLLAKKSGCPVWIGRDRVAAGIALLRAHPECDVLVSDDGLQHYRLERDMEIVVVDGERKFGNGLLLPAGPLREGVSRLGSVDAVVVNGGGPKAAMHLRNEFEMNLQGGVFYNLLNQELNASAADFSGKELHAVAGIGNPQRFFTHLRGLGLVFEEHAFPDHCVFRSQDLDYENADALLMTEKDAVKCVGFADERYWALAVEASLPPAFGQTVLQKLKDIDGRQTA
ncbi:tetraacyldisaccharide 4'-kinase [Sulfuricella denitrificans]|uniref:tetraacyldisaccharide 4'-kinase n=1 Tax=Sulfuricella denitrificans TaxID=649841 RepID=UPI000287C3E2